MSLDANINIPRRSDKRAYPSMMRASFQPSNALQRAYEGIVSSTLKLRTRIVRNEYSHLHPPSNTQTFNNRPTMIICYY